ncbi:MAG: hypothetical protein E7598_06825 [Ruminococcaceae bacterium]|nr:hypothetical protein [Oscillospiraceae bacterium]
MYYCLECTNKILMIAPVKEGDVETRVFYCKNCKRTLPCVIRFKKYDALGKLDINEYRIFEQKCHLELIERWDEPEFQEEKEVFINAIKRKQKEKEDIEKLYNMRI